MEGMKKGLIRSNLPAPKPTLPSEFCGSVCVQHPEQLSVGRSHSLRRKWRIVAAFENLMQHVGLVGARGHEHNFGSVIEHRKGEGDAMRVELCDPVGDDQPRLLVQRSRARKERSSVSIRTHAEQDQIEARKLSGLIRGTKLEEAAELAPHIRLQPLRRRDSPRVRERRCRRESQFWSATTR